MFILAAEWEGTLLDHTKKLKLEWAQAKISQRKEGVAQTVPKTIPNLMLINRNAMRHTNDV